MQQHDLASLIAELSASFNQPTTAINDAILQQKIAPLLTADLQQAITDPVIAPAPVAPPVDTVNNRVNITTAFPFASALFTHSPVVFNSIRSNISEAIKPNVADVVKPNAEVTDNTIATRISNVIKNIGTGISNILHPGGVVPIHPFPIFVEETISVFLDTNPTYPAIILPVTVRTFEVVLPGSVTSYTVDAGSIFILSQLLCSTAPAGMYTGLTISGGQISFNQHMSLVNKVITIPAGSVCSVSLNLQQPVNATVPPGSFGTDALNAQVQLPTQFSFTLTDSIISIVSISQASWNLYGCASTFQYAPAQTPVYNVVQNAIYIGCTVSATTFTVNQCTSPFFTLQGSAPVIDGYWELPVAGIDITQANTASGIGSLAVLCSPGLQANWTGLKGGSATLLFPLLSATIGYIAVMDTFASNRYGTQHYDLWSNETTGLLSALDLNYTDKFTLIYLSMLKGTELLSTTVQFLANIDRPVRVDASPVSVKGKNGLLYQTYTATGNKLFFYDNTLIAENYPTLPGAVAEVPQEAIALTNALMTVTPVSGIVIYGQLATPTTFLQCKLIASFGLFYLIPALPDPYASSRFTILGGLRDGIFSNVNTPQEQKTLPLNDVASLLGCTVSWPQAGATDPAAAQLADVSFGIFPLPNNNLFQAASISNAAVINQANIAAPGPQQRWDQATGQYASPSFAMLDVSTNADLMGVSFSTNSIKVFSDPAAVGYSVQTVDNSAETDILQILGLDLSTPGKFIRAFTVPEMSWEPLVNLTKEVSKSGDPNPPEGFLLFPDDGGPTQLFNNSSVAVSIAPIKVSNFIVDSYTKNDPANPILTASLFTLPFGMRSFALLTTTPEGFQPATLSIDPQVFDITPTGIPNATKKTVTGGLQITAKGQLDITQPNMSAFFPGFSIQVRNVLDANGNATNTSVLGPDVDFIFNNDFEHYYFQNNKTGVPVERIDFSGYGASMFSNWQNPNATIAATSQAKFDVIVGRVSLEIVQVRSLMYPWGVRVVRTITMYRSGSALIYRVDSGWRADTDGVYDFSYKDEGGNPVANPYIFHPGIVKGVFNVRNIIENDLPQFPVQLAGGPPPAILLQPVYFDADVLIQAEYVTQGATNGKVPSKQMLGYVQLAPEGVPITPAQFNQLLISQAGSLGGPVDCIINIGNSGQLMRINRVDLANSTDQAGANPVFAGTARGMVILPKDGSWSVVQHAQLTDSVSAIDNNASVPLIKEGLLIGNLIPDYSDNQLRLANPIDLLRAPSSNTVNYGLLQNTGTQKVLYQLPAYLSGINQLLSKGNKFPLAKFADAFHLLNSTGIFPNPGDIPDMDLSNYSINLIDQGYQLFNKLSPGNLLQQGGIASPFYFVKTKDIQIYVTYNAGDGQNINYDLNSAAENWIASAKNITLNVGLGPFNPLIYIDGNFDSSSGIDAAFNVPTLRFAGALQPVINILQILQQISVTDPDYGAIAKQALQVAMSNSGDNFEYKFHADKEIATLQFPPAKLDGPTTPLRLTAGLKVGAYFNEAISVSSDPSSLIPSAGAYLEFDGGLQIMCVSLAAATVYAVGQVVLRLSADVKTGPAIYMKFGFGVELMVGLPVVGNVSVTYMAGVEMNLTTTDLNVTAFLLFKGEAQLIGGMVDITITIEASGTIDRPAGGSTHITAQVTFAIDISIFLVIDINFSKSWSESRQIA